MKTTSRPRSVSESEPTDDEIRDYAHHLYLQSGCIPGRDLDNWLEARDLLRARDNAVRTETRLPKQRVELVAPH